MKTCMLILIGLLGAAGSFAQHHRQSELTPQSGALFHQITEAIEACTGHKAANVEKLQYLCGTTEIALVVHYRSSPGKPHTVGYSWSSGKLIHVKCFGTGCACYVVTGSLPNGQATVRCQCNSCTMAIQEFLTDHSLQRLYSFLQANP